MPTAALDPRERAGIVRDGLGVGIATGAYGLSFGAVAVAGGLSVAQTCALSLLMFTGASQFALVGVLAAGGSPVSGALTALLLGTRNTLYGLRLAPLLAWRGWRRAAGSHLLIDESTAMSVTRGSTPAAASTGTPAGVNGTSPSATDAAATVTNRWTGTCRRGHSSARNAAPTAASSP